MPVGLNRIILLLRGPGLLAAACSGHRRVPGVPRPAGSPGCSTCRAGPRGGARRGPDPPAGQSFRRGRGLRPRLGYPIRTEQ
eukprot:749063-Hanusia_phi.AAC.3